MPPSTPIKPTPSSPQGKTRIPVSTALHLRAQAKALAATVRAESFEEHQKKSNYNATIGIIGLTPQDVAELNKLIVEEGNKLGLGDDQEHPAVFAVGLGIKEVDVLSQLKLHSRLCLDFGCDLIAIATNSSGGSKIENFIKDELNLTVFSNRDDQDFRPMAKKIVQTALYFKEPKNRPNLNGYDPQKTELDPLTRHNLDIDKKKREKYTTDSLEEYQSLVSKSFGVLGGAGPAASAQFCELLATNGIQFIHCSENFAPGKHRFETGVGPSYIPFYRNIIDFFEQIDVAKIAIPCNTAHNRLEEFCTKSALAKIVDFRAASTSSLTELGHKKAILLGTNATVGVGDSREAKDGAYAKYCRERGIDLKFMIPDEEQQQKIMKAIYLVKSGGKENIERAKSLISKVIVEIKRGKEMIPVLLACTELPLAFQSDDLRRVENLFFDPAKLVIDQQRELNRKRDTAGAGYSSDDSYGERDKIDPTLLKCEAWKDEEGTLRLIMSLKEDTPHTVENCGKLRSFAKSQSPILRAAEGRRSHKEDKEIGFGEKILTTDTEPKRRFASWKISIHDDNDKTEIKEWIKKYCDNIIHEGNPNLTMVAAAAAEKPSTSPTQQSIAMQALQEEHMII